MSQLLLGNYMAVMPEPLHVHATSTLLDCCSGYSHAVQQHSFCQERYQQ